MRIYELENLIMAMYTAAVNDALTGARSLGGLRKHLTGEQWQVLNDLMERKKSAGMYRFDGYDPELHHEIMSGES